MKDILGSWNYYLVRYAVPSIAGGYIIALLVESQSLPCWMVPRSLDTMPLDLQTAIIFWVLGLAYCYLCSAPILFFHAIRGYFWRNECKCEKPAECNGGRNVKFYKVLSSRRSAGTTHPIDSAKKNNVDEYVESYRHLREHGNAFAIIFFEIIFAIPLLWNNSDDCACLVICLLVLAASGAIAWVIATCLEFHIPPAEK